MRATLEFDLDEDKDAYEDCYNGSKYAAVIHEIDEWLRQKIKYGEYSVDVYQQVRDELSRLRSDE